MTHALPTPGPNTPLGLVKTWLKQYLDDGVDCPACGQHAKIYKRKVHSKMAADLFAVARAGGWDNKEWVNVGETVGRSSPDLVKCRYWGLIEAQDGVRDDGSNRIGMWRMTDAGLNYLRGGLIRQYAKIYDGQFLGYDGPFVTVRDALGSKFSYDDLMNGQ